MKKGFAYKVEVTKNLADKFGKDYYVELAENGTDDEFWEIWATPIKKDKCTKGWRFDYSKKIILHAIRFGYSLEKMSKYVESILESKVKEE